MASVELEFEISQNINFIVTCKSTSHSLRSGKKLSDRYFTEFAE